jgi:hypothetical protein
MVTTPRQSDHIKHASSKHTEPATPRPLTDIVEDRQTLKMEANPLLQIDKHWYILIDTASHPIRFESSSTLPS